MTEQTGSQKVLLSIFLLAALMFTAGPLAYMILSSFKPEVEILNQRPTLLPSTWYFTNYRQLFEVTPVVNATKNSVIIACIVTSFTILCATYTAYLLTRLKLRGLDFASKILLFCYALPDVIVGIGFYMIFAKIGALNNYFSVALGQCAITVPFGIWMLWAYFRQIPVDLDEAASIDGASRYQIIRLIILPIAMPGIAAVAVYSFIISWNEYTLANMLITRDDLKTLPIVMGQLVKVEGAFWGLSFAMATVSLIPALLFVFFMLKPLISGLTVGALKG
jgi:multiple sugar transport system permease protein